MKLSKSKINCFNDCPYKFKLLYIDEIPEPRTKFSELADKGRDIHKMIEEFYNNDVKIEMQKFKDINTNEIKEKEVILINKDKYKKNNLMKNFIQFKEDILRKASDNKYFFPIAQEVDYENKELGIHGIVDAIYKHYNDDEYILVDWKTGKIKSIDAIRKELAFYKLCVDGSGQLLKPVRYWAMFFVKDNWLFFEEVKDDVCEKVKQEIKLIDDLVRNEYFEKRKGNHCAWCGFHNTEVCSNDNKNNSK